MNFAAIQKYHQMFKTYRNVNELEFYSSMNIFLCTLSFFVENVEHFAVDFIACYHIRILGTSDRIRGQNQLNLSFTIKKWFYRFNKKDAFMMDSPL